MYPRESASDPEASEENPKITSTVRCHRDSPSPSVLSACRIPFRKKKPAIYHAVLTPSTEGVKSGCTATEDMITQLDGSFKESARVMVEFGFIGEIPWTEERQRTEKSELTHWLLVSDAVGKYNQDRQRKFHLQLEPFHKASVCEEDDPSSASCTCDLLDGPQIPDTSTIVDSWSDAVSNLVQEWLDEHPMGDILLASLINGETPMSTRIGPRSAIPTSRDILLL